MAVETHTVRSLLQKTTPWFAQRGLDTPRLDAELLLSHALGLQRIQLYTDLDRPLTNDELNHCRTLVKRRAQGEPVAYIVGERGFYGLMFQVSPAVLIPRPDTETLVELVLQHIDKTVEGTFVDVGTGSGCIALSVLHHRPLLRAIATDVRADALQVAERNAHKLGVAARVEFRCGDSGAPIHEDNLVAVLANPPYVVRGSGALAADVARFEPEVALYGDDDGLGHHRRYLRDLLPRCAPGALVALEIGHDQQEAALDVGRAAGLVAPLVARDLDGHARVLWGRSTP
jgi:release factor glutamine methyltransferase